MSEVTDSYILVPSHMADYLLPVPCTLETDKTYDMAELVDLVKGARICQIRPGSAEYVHHQCEHHDVYLFQAGRG
jgi:hypothetical protein